jgi:hypothetical protein
MRYKWRKLFLFQEEKVSSLLPGNAYWRFPSLKNRQNYSGEKEFYSQRLKYDGDCHRKARANGAFDGYPSPPGVAFLFFKLLFLK